ncbi:MAG TPA: BTAD domain-containing putative transcriptional regulator, partial [Gemmatimonadales bacterium]|nr:BTAD domain-containing putative transcriptional regulator [Gemmatimonadales bacterium]
MLRINVLGGLYVSDEGRAVSGAAAQPRRLALLALLAVAKERGVTRDALLGYLWPESDEERGRKALAQALYALRRDLGSDEALIGVKDLRLNPDLVQCDLWEFQDATTTGSLDRAAELFRGRFLEGFHLPGADSFEQWVEDTRAGLTHEFAGLLHTLASRATGKGEHRSATGWLRKLAAQDPLNAQVACQLMESLAAQGDVAGALQHARVYETLIRQELDLPPDRDVMVVAARLRGVASGEMPASAPPPVAPPAPSPPPPPVVAPQPRAPTSPPPSSEPQRPRSSTETAIGEIPDDDPSAATGPPTSGWATMKIPPGLGPIAQPAAPGSPRSGRRQLWLAGIAVLITVAAVVLWRANHQVPVVVPVERVVAVGRIAHYTQMGLGGMGRPMADMLATNLARATGMRVISSARMYELLGELASASDTTGVQIVAAARRAGATELIDGALYDVGSGQLRLDLRRVDLASGAVLHAYTIQAPDLFTLADSGTSRLVDDLGGRAPVGSLADVSTKSVEAYRAYEAGLRTFFEGKTADAEKLFAEALAKDSAFAMAQFYYSLATSNGSRAEVSTRLQRAVELAERASDRERLLIRATWAFYNSSPSIRAYAETLTVRYPTELEGYLMAGQGAILAADFRAARGPLLEVIDRDSLGLKGQTVRCLACEALETLIGSMGQEDSLAAALALARRWARLQPNSGKALRYQAMLLGQMGYPDSARRALALADSIDPGAANRWRYLTALEMWKFQYDSAAELARAAMQTGSGSDRVEGSWILAIAYRNLGRLNEALVQARAYRIGKADQTPRGAAPLSAYLEAQVLFEMNRFRESGLLFDSISRASVPFEDSSNTARTWVWSTTHRASALAAQGDTSRLAMLADSMQREGQISGLERDRRLHHYVRGLLFASRGNDEQAVTEFREAITSRNSGYTRINYELARALLRLRRPREAVAVLQPVTRGIFEGASLYLTHSDAHELLGKAWEAAGNADSAAYHYRLVAKLWENADPGF